MTASTTLNNTVSALANLSLDSADDGSTEVRNTSSVTLIPSSAGFGSSRSVWTPVNLDAPISPLMLDSAISRPTTVQDDDKMRNDIDSGNISSSKGDRINGSEYNSRSNQKRKSRGLVSMTAGNEDRKRSARSEMSVLQWSNLRRWGLNKTDTDSSSSRELGKDIKQAVAMSTKVKAIETEVIATDSYRGMELDAGLEAEHSNTFEEAWNVAPLIAFTPINGSKFQAQERDTALMAAHEISPNEARIENNGPKKKAVKQRKVTAEKRLSQLSSADKKILRAQSWIHFLKTRASQTRIRAAKSLPISKVAESKAAEAKAVMEKMTSPPPPPSSSRSTPTEKKGVSKKKKKKKSGEKRAKKEMTGKEVAALSLLIESLNIDGAAVAEASEETKT